MQVIDAYRVLGDAVAEFVGFAVDGAASEAATGGPDAVAGSEMITPVTVRLSYIALNEDRSTKLADPNDDGVVQHSPLFEVLDEGGGRLIGVSTLERELGVEIGVLVPAAVHELDKPNAAFD